MKRPTIINDAHQSHTGLKQTNSLDRREFSSTVNGQLNRELLPEWEIKTAISIILGIALKPISFQKQLQEILNTLVSISWLKAANRGAIFIANGQRELVLVAQHDLSPELIKKCVKVPFGRCLCGKAAETKKIQFTRCLDNHHDNRFEGMEDHGHYNLPLLDTEGKVLGVVVLYLECGHQQHPDELQFMEMLGHTLSNIILSRSFKLRAEISSIRFQQAQLEMTHKLIAASEFRDNETGEHIKRMSQYAVTIGKRIDLSTDDLKLLELAAPMHDIGKVGISDKILLKPSRLTREEFIIMQEHTEIGARILTGTHSLVKASRDIAWTHHEKWDGSGYPRGLSGDNIPLFGRICAIADVFDALTSERPYKKAWSVEKAVECIKEGSSSHFDPNLVQAFLDGIDDLMDIMEIYADKGEEQRKGRLILLNKPVSKEIVSWHNSLSVGVDHIDKQHQYFINLINRIHGAIENSYTAKIVEALLDMKAYTEVHFTDEENFMARKGYPRLDEHIALHRGFIRKAESFLDDLEQHPLAISSEVSNYLVTWAVEHIQKVDAKYGDFLREGVTAQCSRKGDPQCTTIKV